MPGAFSLITLSGCVEDPENLEQGLTTGDSYEQRGKILNFDKIIR
jgi:hypothetical protein